MRIGVSTGLVAAAFCLLGLCTAGGGVVINEFMAQNDTKLKDQDGDYSDWMELFNDSASNVNLAGWCLTDAADDLQKWTFPAVSIGAGGYLIVFASNKNRAVAGSELHTNFKLAANGEYLALVRPDGTVASGFAPEYPPQYADVSYGVYQRGIATPIIVSGAVCRVKAPADGALGDTWTAADFDDSSWVEGRTGVGYDGGTALPKYLSLIGTDVRQAMAEATNTSCYIRIPFTIGESMSFDALSLRIKYDDGFVAYINGRRVASANAADPVTWNATAVTEHPRAAAVVFETNSVENAAGFVQAGVNVLAIQGVNRPSSAEGRQPDFLILPELDTMLSRAYFSTPTPGAANAGAVLGAVGDTKFNPDRGFYTNALAVAITSETAGADIRYTTDSDLPAAGGMLYSGPVAISNSTVVRARGF